MPCMHLYILCALVLNNKSNLKWNKSRHSIKCLSPVGIFSIWQKIGSQIWRRPVERGNFVRTFIMMSPHCPCCGNATSSSHYRLVPQWYHDELRETNRNQVPGRTVGWLRTWWNAELQFWLMCFAGLLEVLLVEYIKRVENALPWGGREEK